MPSTLTGRFRAKLENGSRTRRKSRLFSLTQAILVIALILLCARFVTVLVTSFREEPAFTAPKTIYLPQRELEHQMEVTEFQNAAATPATIPALTTESLLANMPALPQIPNVDFTPVENEVMVSSGALFGESGLMGALGAISSQASSVSFLGITEEAARFVIIVDVSDSFVAAVEAAGMDFNAIKEESEKLINNLNANTLFGFIQHVRAYDTFQDDLIPATVSNKGIALKWLDKKLKKIGENSAVIPSVNGHENGILTVLDFAFKMQPDVIFLISDGGYFSKRENGSTGPVPLGDVLKLISSLQKELPSDARIHAIHFPDPRKRDDGRIGSGMRRIADRNDGQYRRIGK